MHVIKKKTLREYWKKHANVEGQLRAWHKEAERVQWRNSAELKKRYPKAKIINNEYVVFKICGNKYRLVVKIKYDMGLVFIRWFGTHKEYDRVKVEEL